MIMGANAYPEVLTVGGCDTDNDVIGYSSKTRRNYLPDTGVSAACPVAAGCIAALRTKALPEATRPDALFSIIKQTARGNKSGPGGTWNGDFGHGIIDPVEAARRLGLIQ
jgi:subtilisin family serine protease